ncbi:hypothetical protein SSS_05610 [Sarcoptes scabiei]|nr:hypothetical protein SSS_05610 [Sarcoptes scabiei]
MDLQRLDNFDQSYNNLIAIFSFGFADLLVLIAAFLPDWIVYHIGGTVRIGLWRSCVSNQKQLQNCFRFEPALVWKIAIVLLLVGLLLNSSALLLFCIALNKPRMQIYARWLGLLTILSYSVTSILIPIGYSMEQIQGEFFQLPAYFYAGLSYIIFNISLWIIALSELIASRLCSFNFMA